MSDGMRRELVYLSSHATNRYFIPNWGNIYPPTAIEKTYYRAVVTSLPQCGYVVTALR